MTDVHALPAAELQTMVKELDGRNIDLLVLGGDFSQWGCGLARDADSWTD